MEIHTTITEVDTKVMKETEIQIIEVTVTVEITTTINEDQQILNKFYNAHEETCSSINTIESNPIWILPMHQCSSLETNFTKQKPILKIDFKFFSRATLNHLSKDTWNKLKYKNPYLQLTKSTKTLAAANNTKIHRSGNTVL